MTKAQKIETEKYAEELCSFAEQARDRAKVYDTALGAVAGLLYGKEPRYRDRDEIRWVTRELIAYQDAHLAVAMNYDKEEAMHRARLGDEEA